MMKCALLLMNGSSGTEKTEAFHALQHVLKEEMRLEKTNEIQTVTLEMLQRYDCIISYDDADLQHVSAAFAAAVLSYVAMGGGWLALHHGTRVENKVGLATVLGALQVSELPEQAFHFVVTAPEHPVMCDCSSFSMSSAADQYHFSTIKPGPKQDGRAILFEYEHNRTVGTAGWAQEFGLGRIVGIAVCSRLSCLEQPSFAKIIRQAAQWLSKNIL